MPFVRKKIPVAPSLATKWPGKTLDEGFTPFPKRLLRCMNNLFIGPHPLDDLKVVLAIVDYQRPDLTRPPSLEFLAFTAGTTPTKFKERVDSMVGRGWLKVSGSDDALRIKIDGLIQQIEAMTPDEEPAAEDDDAI